MTRPDFSRHVLPALAVLAIIVSAWVVLATQPDRSRSQPVRTPPSAPSAAPVVAGAGVVEPSSELIEIGAEVPGVIDRLNVEVGQSVAAGAPLFSVDSREARAAVAEAQARLLRIRQTVVAARTTLGVARRQLIDTPGREYPDTRLWSAALHRRDKDTHGMAWSSRPYPSADAMLLFGDRLPAAALGVVLTTAIDDDPGLLARFRQLAERSGVTLVT